MYVWRGSLHLWVIEWKVKCNTCFSNYTIEYEYQCEYLCREILRRRREVNMKRQQSDTYIRFNCVFKLLSGGWYSSTSFICDWREKTAEMFGRIERLLTNSFTRSGFRWTLTFCFSCERDVEWERERWARADSIRDGRVLFFLLTFIRFCHWWSRVFSLWIFVTGLFERVVEYIGHETFRGRSRCFFWCCSCCYKEHRRVGKEPGE